MTQIIATKNDMKNAVEELVLQCELMKKIYQNVGAPPLRKRNKGFAGLLRIIVGQQLSIASANAIWSRVLERVPLPTAKKFQLLQDQDFKQCGISRPKVKTIRALCNAIAAGQLNFTALQRMKAEEIHHELTQIHGIGPWTADIYTMFCLGHADAWAPGDLALQYAVQDILGLDKKPDISQTLHYADRWRPLRGIAARLLWSHYSFVKDNKKVTPL